ncbi:MULTISPECIES: tetratricopeptide repeat protein [Flavobacterium]|jgi:tetratricopeptide (TPR) repeat protein|uniref:Tetratricopeptide repeat protein n=1 Tax=Flavobacterium lindanitolerans TaxID=428988 RepID=A0A497VFJ9_9FLAO|nr:MULTISPECIES: tetratricopeptide repeat protein [Flavobacterium]MBL7867616.1 tetratricopeptide repeat protein [Flavobacterium lindanitolerans]OJX52712.1 MAG: BatC protein [Flavobacterium sp. 38-13]PKW28994.1 tetratricopeptide repeat protein [Flavobacterium lindanitolerans]RLJ35503.1 tetratricopeptide repeat protein [Flavobacterium lindanitolerans]
MRQLLIYTLLLFSFAAIAQEKDKDKNLPRGNKEFKEKNYVDAEAEYRISLSKSPTKAIASYNLGNTIYKQKQPSEAKLAYVNTIENAKTKAEKHKAFHNLGNIFMTEKKYSDAVEAYKNALRNNPADEQTRYNYALAKEYLKNNPEPPKDDKKKDKDKKEKDKDKKNEKDDKKEGDKGDDKKENKDKGEDKKDKQDGKNGEGKNDKDSDQKGQPKPQPGNSPSKQRIENLLDAVNNEEKKIQEKVNAKKVKGKPVQTEKDW